MSPATAQAAFPHSLPLLHPAPPRYNLPRIYFGGFFIRGHPYTMDTISFAIQFWSKGEMSAKFLRHEGFLGAVGAYLKVPSLQIFDGSASASEVRKGWE